MRSIFEKGKEINFSEEYVLWGVGRKCEELLELCKSNIKIKYCVDKDPQKVGKIIHGIPVYPIDKIWENEEKKKIIITSQAYLKIKETLLENGINEDDIFIYSEWEVFYAWLNLKQIILPSIAIITGNVCNLNCRGCIAYVPYSKNRKNFKFSEMKETIDSFFRIVDYVGSITFGGGEPFLNNDLGSIIEYLYEKYEKKFGRIDVHTNGTILPKEEFFNLCSLYNLYIRVSDYSKTMLGGYIQLENKLTEHKIPYTIERDFVRDDKINYWYDMGNPEFIQNKSEEELKELFSKCITNCRVLYNNKLWYCCSMVMAELGLGIQMEPSDYCDMKIIDKNKEEDVEEFLKHYLGYPLNDYYSMCKRCNGMGAYVNNKFIPAGEQIDKN